MMKTGIQQCESHKQALSLFCSNESCQQFLCPECVDLHKGHLIVSMKGLKANIEQEVDRLLEQNEKSANLWGEKKEMMKGNVKNFMQQLWNIVETTKTLLQKHWKNAEAKASEKLSSEYHKLEDGYRILSERIEKGMEQSKELVNCFRGLKSVIGEDSSEALKNVITKLQEGKKRSESLLNVQTTLLKDLDNTMQNTEAKFAAQSIKLVGRFELALKAASKDEATATRKFLLKTNLAKESVERTREECKEILEGISCE